jgi:hypothetical protein
METPTQIEVGRFRGSLQYPPPRGVDSPFVRFWCAVLLYFVAGWCLASAQQQPLARLALIPPSPVTDKIMLDIRGAVENTGDRARLFTVSLYLDQESSSARVRMQRVEIPAHSSAGIFYRRSTQGWAGRHRVILVAASEQDQLRSEREVQVLPSDFRSTRTIDGAWVGIVHWSEEEGRHWNADIRKLTEDDWRQQIRAMHNLGMDTVVIQEVFRNEAYYGTHPMDTEGYHGLAYYPSALYPGRVSMTAHDPIEAILSEADRLNMNVFLGVGAYAWFDFSPGALTWSKQVAAELWKRYSRHPSFYGWYVSAEAYGSLIPDQGEADKIHYRQQVVDFFREFQAYCRRIAPEKPVMLAPNAHGMLKSREVWPLILKHIDIVCPFAFHRMPSGDMTGEQAAQLWQSMSDKAGAHLWMDMEAFLFDGKALVPRPIDGLIQDMQRFPNFEKILCYQYPGIFNAPGLRITPGGPPTVVLYNDYRKYLQTLSRPPQTTSP